ncbi:hypothetical protein AAZX31_04G140800 [Glycine max]
MFNADPSFPNVPTLITEQIQKYLEENKELILAILEHQNLGKFTEIAQLVTKVILIRLCFCCFMVASW